MKTRLWVCFLVILIFGVCIHYSIADDYDWPRWRGPNGDGISIETDWNPEALKDGPKIIWTKNIGKGYSNVAIKGKYLYTMGWDNTEDTVYCLKAKNGKEVWRYSYTNTKMDARCFASPAIDGDSVYVISEAGRIFCLNAANGELQWDKDIHKKLSQKDPRYKYAPYGFSGSPVIDGGLIILNYGSFGITLDKTKGEEVWISPPGDPGHSTPVLYENNGRRYVAITGLHAVHSVDVNTGRKTMSYEWEGGNAAADPIVYDNHIFISSLDFGCALLEMNGSEPEVMWQNQNMRQYFSSAVLIDGYVYGFCGDMAHGPPTSLRCIEWETGKLMWEHDIKKTISITAANNKLIVLDEYGSLFIAVATPTSYQEISRCKVYKGRGTFWTPPVLCRGRIYCRNSGGELICIDVSK